MTEIEKLNKFGYKKNILNRYIRMYEKQSFGAK